MRQKAILVENFFKRKKTDVLSVLKELLIK